MVVVVVVGGWEEIGKNKTKINKKKNEKHKKTKKRKNTQKNGKFSKGNFSRAPPKKTGKSYHNPRTKK